MAHSLINPQLNGTNLIEFLNTTVKQTHLPRRISTDFYEHARARENTAFFFFLRIQVAPVVDKITGIQREMNDTTIPIGLSHSHFFIQLIIKRDAIPFNYKQAAVISLKNECESLPPRVMIKSM